VDELSRRIRSRVDRGEERLDATAGGRHAPAIARAGHDVGLDLDARGGGARSAEEAAADVADDDDPVTCVELLDPLSWVHDRNRHRGDRLPDRALT